MSKSFTSLKPLISKGSVHVCYTRESNSLKSMASVMTCNRSSYKTMHTVVSYIDDTLRASDNLDITYLALN